MDIVLDHQAHTARLTKLVSGSEPFALGHYPGNVVFPGVLLIELALVACEALHGSSPGTGRGELKRFQFVDRVEPGDVLDVTVTRKSTTRDGHTQYGAQFHVGPTLKARGTISL